MNVAEELCMHDPRNPLYADIHDPDDATAPCGSCDSCFYGKHALADKLLSLSEKLAAYLKAQETDEHPEDHWILREGLREALANVPARFHREMNANQKA